MSLCVSFLLHVFVCIISVQIRNLKPVWVDPCQNLKNPWFCRFLAYREVSYTFSSDNVPHAVENRYCLPLPRTHTYTRARHTHTHTLTPGPPHTHAHIRSFFPPVSPNENTYTLTFHTRIKTGATTTIPGSWLLSLIPKRRRVYKKGPLCHRSTSIDQPPGRSGRATYAHLTGLTITEDCGARAWFKTWLPTPSLGRTAKLCSARARWFLFFLLRWRMDWF